MADYECIICGKIISDKELYNNDGMCDECLLEEKDRKKNTYQGINNVDEILEKRRDR